MDHVEFRTVEQELGGGGIFPVVVPYLDGVPLPTLHEDERSPG